MFYRHLSTAQTIVNPIYTPTPSLTTKTLITASPCLTITSLLPHTSCKPMICPDIACLLRYTTSTVPCGCQSPPPTVYRTSTCGCPPCGPIETAIVSATCQTKLCPTITESSACPVPSGCVTPDCILLETLPIPCGCTGIHTTRSCDGKCHPSCETWYTGLALPCPLTTLIAS